MWVAVGESGITADLPTAGLIIRQDRHFHTMRARHRLRGMRRRQVRVGLACSLLSMLLLVALLRRTDWAAVLTLLRGARLDWVLFGVSGLAVTVIGKALMWRVLLAVSGPLSVWSVTRAVVLGLTVNNLLPGRIGEPFRASVVALEARRDVVPVLATVLVEILANGVLFVTIGIVALARSGSLPWFDRAAPVLLAGCLLVLLGLLLVVRRPQPEAGGRLRSLLARVRTGSLALGRPLAIVQIVAWGALSIGGQLVLLTGAQRALGLALPLPALALTVAAMNLAGALPSAPGALGTLELGALGALSLHEVPHSLAVSSTLLFHALVTLPVTGLGIFLLARAGMRLSNAPLAELEPGEEAAQEAQNGPDGPQGPDRPDGLGEPDRTSRVEP
jgi:uncharacterized membrane protein YbhN (UPF0104 family)